MRHREPFTSKLVPMLALLTLSSLLLHGCRDPMDARELPDFATTADKQLKIAAMGTGSGLVTAPSSGGRKSISCTVTAGVAAAGTECARYYPINTVVTLSAPPAPGSTFPGWSDSCAGSGTCTVTVSGARKVTVKFTGPPQSFALTVTG